MKIRFLMTGLVGLVSTTVFAQNSEVNKANVAFGKVEVLRGTPALAKASLTEAKTAIDKAAADKRTANEPFTFALKGVIYAYLTASDTVDATSQQTFVIAEEALKKAKETDKDKKYASYVENGTANLAQWQLNKGVKEYTNKKYDLAYKAFDYYRQYTPEDTTAIYYTALAATNAKLYPEAITNYKKLVTTKYSKIPSAYLDMSTIHLVTKDTTASLKVIGEGIEKYPTNQDLRRREIEISLLSGKQQEVLGKIQAAITNDPKNKSLYYYSGLTYAQFADALAKSIKKETVATKKAAFQAERDADFTKASDMFQKALEIDPNYFEAVLNLGYTKLSPGIDIFNAAQQLTKQKDYDIALAKANAQFDAAKPFIMKAVELQPNNLDALSNLKLYYLGTKDTVKASEVQKRIDTASKQQ
jgi:tetratricopeptide (TPR) repeat protein